MLANGYECDKIIPIGTMLIHDEQELGRAVRTRRKEQGLTLTELASVVPCSPRLLSELERGRRGVSIALILKLLALLGLELHLNGREAGKPSSENGTAP